MLAQIPHIGKVAGCSRVSALAQFGANDTAITSLQQALQAGMNKQVRDKRAFFTL